MTMVIAQHCGLMPFGWTGVWLFFVISGYVITRNFIHEAPTDIWSSLGQFFRRRFFRIVPVYLLYLLIVIALSYALIGEVSFQSLPYLLSFTFNWYMVANITDSMTYIPMTQHLWTISVEEQFYLVFPFLFLFSSRRNFLWLLIAFIAAGPLVRLVYEHASGLTEVEPLRAAFGVYAASICHFDAFLIGALIARLEPELRSRNGIGPLILKAAIACAALYVMAYIFINRQNGATGLDQFRNIISGIYYGQGREIIGYSVINFVAAALIVNVLVGNRYFQWLGNSTLTGVGRVSYGGYLFHVLVLHLAYNYSFLGPEAGEALSIPQRLVLFAVVLPVTIGIAYVSFNWFESPISRWSRKPADAARADHSTALAPVRSMLALPDVARTAFASLSVRSGLGKSGRLGRPD